jgi:hypothetical protein
MKLKTLIVSIVVLAALAVVVFISRREPAPVVADARINQPLVERATVEKAAKLRLSDAGKTVEVVQAGGAWRVPSYYDMPADFSKLSGFIGSLTDAKLQRLVTTNPDRIARLEFKDTKIELLDSADKPVWSVTLGKNAETGGGRYVRFGDEQKAYLASLNAFLDTEPKNWANAELINLKADDVAKVEIPFAEGGPITVSRAKKEDAWTADKTPAGQKVKADKVSTTISSLGNIRFTDTSAPDDANVAAARANLRTLKLTTFDNKTYTIALGRKPEEKKLKPPTPLDPTKKEEPKPGEEKKDEKDKLAPEFETVPAGPVYASVTSSDASAPINTLMQKRAFQISDYTFTGLPQKPEELFEPAPAPPEPKAEEKKSDAKK